MNLYRALSEVSDVGIAALDRTLSAKNPWKESASLHFSVKFGGRVFIIFCILAAEKLRNGVMIS